jgi:hypothetical protein
MTLYSLFYDLWEYHIFHQLSRVDMYCLSLVDKTHRGHIRMFIRARWADEDLPTTPDCTVTAYFATCHIEPSSWSSAFMHNLRIARIDDMPEHLVTLACVQCPRRQYTLAGALRACPTDADALILLDRLKAHWLPRDEMLCAVIYSARVGIFVLRPAWLRYTRSSASFLEAAIMSGSVAMVDLLAPAPLSIADTPEARFAMALSVSDEMALRILPPAEKRTRVPYHLLVACQRLPSALPRLRVFYPDEESQQAITIASELTRPRLKYDWE